MSQTTLEAIVSLAKRRGFIYQGSEIYGGLAGVYDYGPLGVELKRNLANLWWQKMVGEHDNIYGLDSAILMNPKVWESSGHVAGFTDPLIECNNCHSRFREDHVDISKPCPVCGKKDTYGQPRQFNMMLKTQLGATEDSGSVSYLRPETAQGIFVNYKNIMDSFSPKLPFGIAQIGKAFRNEISPRDFIFRLRELEQMETQYFIAPESQEKEYETWRIFAWDFVTKTVGIDEKKLRWHEHNDKERAHYAAAAHDIEFEFPFGFKELCGTHNRTDFDLSAHAKTSGKDLNYFDQAADKKFVPYVIESSMGLDRLVLAVLSSAYCEDEQGGEKRTFLKLPADLAPYKVAVCPLAKNKPELVDKAKEIYKNLKKEIGNVMWVDTGNIGKNYRRADEIGVPAFITVDFQSLEDNTVTLRNRDTTEQQRIKIEGSLQLLKFSK